VSAGPHVQSMKKHGPPPWGMKIAGWRALGLFIWICLSIPAEAQREDIVVGTTIF